MSRNRQGTILIIVAGLSALLASLALTFLARMRSDVEESHALIQYAQAKIMLAAACSYVQETSRLGWDRRIQNPTSTPLVDGFNIHEEAYGWVDVRDGEPGPRNYANAPLAPTTAGKWPNVGGAVRCPMYRMVRPPWAIRQTTGYNLMLNDPARPDLLWPLLKNPDPQPVTDNFYSSTNGSAANTKFAEFREGDKQVVATSAGKAWFRVYRDGLGTFIVTCGSGGTQGFKDWNEVNTLNESALFGGASGSSLFNGLRASEIRLWYRIEWTAAAMETSYHNLFHEIGNNPHVDHYETWPPNSSHTWSSSRRTQTWAKNPVGTIRWIQRLMSEPTNW